MTLPYSQSSTTYRTVSVASEPNVTGTLLSPGEGTTYRTVSVSSAGSQVPVQYINGAIDGNAVYGGVRYLVPVQRADSYMVVNQGAHVVSQVMPQVMPQVVTPVYLQNVGVQRVSVGSVEEVEVSI